MKELKKAEGRWEYELWLNCPYCDSPIIDIDNCCEGESFEGEVKCPECGKKFIAEID